MANQRFSRFPFWVEAPSGIRHLLTEFDAELASDGKLSDLGAATTKCGKPVWTGWGDPEPRADLFHPSGKTCGGCC
jgi:hypothetical protein